MMKQTPSSVLSFLDRSCIDYSAVVACFSLLMMSCQLDPSSYEPDAGPVDSAGVMMAGESMTSGASAGNTAGDVSGTLAGTSAGETAGDAAGEIAGEIAGEAAGEIAGEVAGEIAGGPAGESAGAVAGESAGEQAGASAGAMAGMSAGEEMAPERCSVQVSVTLPLDTPSGDTIYMASDIFEPQWLPNDEQGALIREDNLARGVILFPNFTNVAYKFTRGDWETVEVNEDCTERANRFSFIRCAAGEELTIEEEVTTWKGTGNCP